MKSQVVHDHSLAINLMGPQLLRATWTVDHESNLMDVFSQ